MLQIELGQDADAALRAEGFGDDASRVALMNDLLEEFLFEREALRIAEERSAELRRGESHTIPLSEVLRKYGLEG